MENKKRFNVEKRRKRQGKTNYKKRLKLLLSNKPRIVVRLSLNKTYVQIIEYHPKGDIVIVSSNSCELEKYGWIFSKTNIPAAYLTGFLAGNKAISKNIKDAILDLGFKTPKKGSKIFACLKGAIDAGLNVPYSKEILPSEDRIKGKHIIDFYNNSAKSKDNYKNQFSDYTKKKLELSKMPKMIEEIKNKIREGK